MFQIIIPGNPIPHKRHRYVNLGSFTQEYDPQKKVKEQIRNTLIPENLIESGLFTIESILHVDLMFDMEIPKSYPKSKKKRSLEGLIIPTRCDIDNLQKFILDCCNGILWFDDRQIGSISAEKRYSENPQTVINIKIIDRNKNGLPG